MPEAKRSLTRAEYYRMAELGMFEDKRVELLRGELVEVSPLNPPHAETVSRLTELLVPALRGRFRLRIQSSFVVSDDSEPEPDVAVVALGNYNAEHPRTALLVIEVSDSTLRLDRRKAALYALAGVPEYWIVNLRARTVEVYTSPDGERYADRRTVGAGEILRPALLGDVAIAVADMLPVV
jgi:Uma2 family endonuclease